MKAAGKNVDDAVGGLGGGKISLGLAVGGIHGEGARPGASLQGTFPAVCQQTLHRPGLALVIGQSHKGPVFCEADKEQRPFVQTPEYQPLAAVDGREFAGRYSPAAASVAGNALRHVRLAVGPCLRVAAAQCQPGAVCQLYKARVDAANGRSSVPGISPSAPAVPSLPPGPASHGCTMVPSFKTMPPAIT